MISTLLRHSRGVALASTLLAGTGCSFLRAAGESILDEEVEEASSPAPGSRGSATPEAAGPGHEGSRREGRTDQKEPRSTYAVSPALTWATLQLERPHALTGFAYDRSTLWGPQCRGQPRPPFEVSGESGRSLGEEVTRSGPAWVGVGGSVVTRGMAFSLDQEVAADRALRSGALLARDGPTCTSSYHFYTLVFGGHGTIATENW